MVTILMPLQVGTDKAGSIVVVEPKVGSLVACPHKCEGDGEHNLSCGPCGTEVQVMRVSPTIVVVGCPTCDAELECPVVNDQVH